MKIKRIISFSLAFLMLTVQIAYADTVVLSNAPNNNSNLNNGVVSSSVMVGTQNSIYNGPAAVPSNGTILGGYSTVNTFTNTNVNNNTFSTKPNSTSDNYVGPNTQTVSSPRANDLLLASSTSKVIGNGTPNTPGEGVSYTKPVARDLISPGSEYTVEDNTYGPNQINVTGSSAPGVSGATQVNPSTVTTTNSATGRQYPVTSTQQTATSQQQTTTNNTNVVNSNQPITYTLNDGFSASKPSISAPSAILVNSNLKQIYFHKNGLTLQAPASLVNLVTAYLLITHKGLEDQLLVSARAVNNLESGASTAGLRAGDTISVKDAIGAMFTKSCCDVANAVAENVSGSIENFVTLMNQTVKSFGCNNTNLVNPTGLNNDLQVTTVLDMAIIMDKITEIPQLTQFLSLTKYTLPATSHRKSLVLYSKNTIIAEGSSNHYQGVVASRLGYTSKALYTIASVLVYNNVKFIAVVLHANGTQFSDTKKLFNYAKTIFPEAAARSQTSVGTSFGQGTSIANTTTATTNTNAGSISASANAQGGSWQKDGNGWYYVKANGQRAVNEWLDIANKRYCVDASGYMITGWRDFTNGKRYFFDNTTGELKMNTWINTANGAFYLQADGSLAKADPGSTKNITTAVGVYTIDDSGKAIAKVS